MTLAEMKKKLATLGTQLRDAQAKLTADGATDADFEAAEKLADEYEALDKRIKQVEKVERSAALTRSVPTDAEVDEETDEYRSPAVPAEKLKAGDKIGLLCASMVSGYHANGYHNPTSAFADLDKRGYGAVAKEFARAQRTMTTTSTTAGGILVPTDMSGEIIELLRPNSTFLRGNPRRIPMPNGNFRQLKNVTGATAGYRGETKPATASEATWTDINMSAKILTGLVPVSNQLIRYAMNDVQTFVQQDLSETLGQTMDLYAYTGNGVGQNPLGITKISGIGSSTATNSISPTYAQTDADASVAELSMENANLPMTGAAWVMAPRTLKYLKNLRDGNGNLIYPTLQGRNPTWREYPVLSSTQVSITGGSGSNESEIWLVAFSHVLFGEAVPLVLSVSTEATVTINGEQVSAFQNGVTFIKAEMEHDFGVRHLGAVFRIKAVKWGAAA